MGLWLKCPGCQTRNPLSARACLKCGQNLDNLPRDLRVYVLGPAEAAPEVPPAPPAEPAASAAAAPAGPEEPKPAKKPKKPRKKKS